MANCRCAGNTCSCTIAPGIGTVVRGTGTAVNPFQIDVDPGTLAFGSAITTSDSDSIDFTKTGTGSAGDPVILSARVLLTDSNGVKYTLSVSTAGVLSAVAAP